MKNTSENKARFFNIYRGLPVFYIEGLDKLKTKPHDEILVDDHVILRSISSLTDDEIIECCRLMEFSDWDNHLYLQERKQTIIKAALCGALWQKCTDYIRSIGILIPFMGLSTETIIEYGWAKLTPPSN